MQKGIHCVALNSASIEYGDTSLLNKVKTRFGRIPLIRCSFNRSRQDSTHSCYPAQPYHSNPQLYQNIMPFLGLKERDVRRSQGIGCQSPLHLGLSAFPSYLRVCIKINAAPDTRRCPLDQACPNNLPRPPGEGANLGIGRTLRIPPIPSP